jgi:3D-(3,5/4)-trihydroxycyclohexane-1,2-dione acylhydrolase (decyclizing)
MSPTELVTAVQENLKITVVLSENHGYQCIRQLQIASSGNDFGNEFRVRDHQVNRLSGEYVSIDLVKIAEGMGARTWLAKTPSEMCQALREARAETRPCVIVAPTEPYRYAPGSEMWWDVAPAEVSGDPNTQEIRKAYENERRKRQKFYY